MSSPKTTINDLPDEILLEVLREVSDVSRGYRMYFFDFPAPAAVCQKWYSIYFEFYWKKWGFLHCRKSTMAEWDRLLEQRNAPRNSPPITMLPTPANTTVEPKLLTSASTPALQETKVMPARPKASKSFTDEKLDKGHQEDKAKKTKGKNSKKRLLRFQWGK